MAGRQTIRRGHRAGRRAAADPTDGWTVDELGDRIAEVRALYERTLEHWPESDEDLAALQ